MIILKRFLFESSPKYYKNGEINFSWDSQAWDRRSISWPLISITSCFSPSFFLPMIFVAKEILFFPITYVETKACKQLRPTKS